MINCVHSKVCKRQGLGCSPTCRDLLEKEANKDILFQCGDLIRLIEVSNLGSFAEKLEEMARIAREIRELSVKK